MVSSDSNDDAEDYDDFFVGIDTNNNNIAIPSYSLTVTLHPPNIPFQLPTTIPIPHLFLFCDLFHKKVFKKWSQKVVSRCAAANARQMPKNSF